MAGVVTLESRGLCRVKAWVSYILHPPATIILYRLIGFGVLSGFSSILIPLRGSLNQGPFSGSFAKGAVLLFWDPKKGTRASRTITP